MRIISGKYKGRKLKSPDNNQIRPTSDRLRENLFNVIIHSDLGIEDILVMDIFAGTGAMGLEALSRGAEKCIFVEKSLSSIKILKQNIQALGLEDQSQILTMDAASIGKTIPMQTKAVELVMMDAPFPKAEELTTIALNGLYEGDWLAGNAWVVAKLPSGLSFVPPTAYEVIRELKAGASKALIMQLKNEMRELK